MILSSLIMDSIGLPLKEKNSKTTWQSTWKPIKTPIWHWWRGGKHRHNTSIRRVGITKPVLERNAYQCEQAKRAFECHWWRMLPRQSVSRGEMPWIRISCINLLKGTSWCFYPIATIPFLSTTFILLNAHTIVIHPSCGFQYGEVWDWQSIGSWRTNQYYECSK